MTNSKKCTPPIRICPENIYWSKAILKNSENSELGDLLLDLIEASASFYYGLIEFLRFILDNTSKNKDKICQLNITRSGFHFCTCFAANRPKEAIKPFAFLICFENDSIGCIHFNLGEITKCLNELENDFEPITEAELAQTFN
ncbi:MAG: hypothetical protein QNJ65_19085 [Xenococcaceae cyanobacterium MO_234.B1]|nr:hypothetical protein [Xenococcaceae cyanobacterium MO_234.B1]